MATSAGSILSDLDVVSAERARRSESPELAEKVAAIKLYQQRRFSRTYADLLGSVRYGPASRYFLEELYGPGDFTQRDTQFARVIPALVRIFPKEVVDMVRTLAELHALSEMLDSRMAMNLPQPTVNGRNYLAAWQATGSTAERQRQIMLTVQVGVAMDRVTRKPLMRNSLRLMRGPARAAGLRELQHFLEVGFDTFKSMGGAQEFLALVEERESRLSSALFEANAVVQEEVPPGIARAMELLP